MPKKENLNIIGMTCVNCSNAIERVACKIEGVTSANVSFTAGVGENQAGMREEVCKGMEFLGVKFDAEKNKTRGEEAVISADDSKVTVCVIPTDEELMIATDTMNLL